MPTSQDVQKNNINNNAILALRYQKVNHGVNHQMAKKINRQPSNEQANISRQMSLISLIKN